MFNVSAYISGYCKQANNLQTTGSMPYQNQHVALPAEEAAYKSDDHTNKDDETSVIRQFVKDIEVKRDKLNEETGNERN
jgi:hypothetical protein